MLKILNLNVWSGLNYRGYLKMDTYESALEHAQRYQALLKQIRNLQPDIIGLHEANKLPGYAHKISRTLGYDAFYHVGLGGIRLGPIGLPYNLREGDLILTKKNLEAKWVGRRKLTGGYAGNFLTFHFSDVTQVIAVRVCYQQRPIYIFVTHWHASPPITPEFLDEIRNLKNQSHSSEKEYQAVLSFIKKADNRRIVESNKTLDFINKTVGPHPFILMGDFNAVFQSSEIQHLISNGLVDTYDLTNPRRPGHTWDPDTNLNHKKYYRRPERYQSLYQQTMKLYDTTPARIDYILLDARAKIKVNSCRLVMNEVIKNVHASDHYGLLAEIEFSEH